MKRKSSIVVLINLLSLMGISYAQPYTVGDIVEDYTFTDYRTGEPTSLYELGSEGGVLVLEWFAWWCPFCANAAANVETGIVEYYENTNGNPFGLPVSHISLNVQGNAERQSDQFIETYNLGTVVEDYSRSFFSLFSPGGGQPLFVVINAEANSPSAEQWEVLYTRLNYSSNAAPDISALMRPFIDSIEPGQVEDPIVTLFPEISDPVDGWYSSEWFGWFFPSEWPLVFHADHGSIYLQPAETNAFFIFDFEWQWLYTSENLYPFLFNYQTGNWLYYIEGSMGEWFYDYSNLSFTNPPSGT